MNLQHAVQHALNIRLVRLHTNKPAGTHGLTPPRRTCYSCESLNIHLYYHPQQLSYHVHILCTIVQVPCVEQWLKQVWMC